MKNIKIYYKIIGDVSKNYAIFLCDILFIKKVVIKWSTMFLPFVVCFLLCLGMRARFSPIFADVIDKMLTSKKNILTIHENQHFF